MTEKFLLAKTIVDVETRCKTLVDLASSWILHLKTDMGAASIVEIPLLRELLTSVTVVNEGDWKLTKQ